MAPPEVTASRWAPGRAVRMPASRSYTSRGRSSANSVEGYLPRQQVQRRLERAARQRGERGAAPHGVEPAVGVERFERGRGDGVLGEDVERVGRHPHGLDLAGEHALDRDRAVDEVGAVLGEQHALGDLADLVSGAADALQPAGHRGRGLHLDDEVDGAHVDAEFQAGGGDHGLEPAGLEVVLDEGALFLADRSVVGLGQQRLARRTTDRCP